MVSARMRTPVARRRSMIVAALVAALLLVGVVVGTQPAAADRLGYALPGPYGLPGHFAFDGQQYSNLGLCAGGSWCATSKSDRISLAQAESDNGSKLHQVGSLPTLFGPSRPIYEPINDPSMQGVSGSNATPFVLYLADPSDPGWLYIYTRPGGP